MVELKKEDLQAKLKEATEGKVNAIKDAESVKIRIDERSKAKQKELDEFTKEQNQIRDQFITQAVEYQGQIKMLEEMISLIDKPCQIVPTPEDADIQSASYEALNKESVEISKEMIENNTTIPEDFPEIK